MAKKLLGLAAIFQQLGLYFYHSSTTAVFHLTIPQQDHLFYAIGHFDTTIVFHLLL